MPPRKKILWLTSWYPHEEDPFDGDFIQRHARAAAIYHDVHVICVNESNIAESRRETWSHSTGLSEQVIQFRKLRGPAAAFRRHVRWQTCFRNAVKAYITREGLPDIVHVHIPWKAGLIALWVKKQFGKPYIISEHWGIYTPSAADHFHSRSLIAQKLLRKIFTESSGVVTVSRFLANAIRNITGRNSDFILPNVVDTALFYPKNEKYSRFSFIHVSNMVPLKNAGKILQAFAELHNKHPEAQLIMVGNRDDQYVKEAGALGLLNQSVFFRGEISYVDVAEEMRRCHCMVLFSDSETFSCVTAEALCSGLPVIASGVGALPELISGENGKLVTAGDVFELAKAMEEVLEHYHDYDARKISAAASARYSYTAVSQAFADLYAADFCSGKLKD